MPPTPKPRLLGLAINLRGAYVTIDAVLSTPVSLQLLYTYTPPIRVPRFRTIRGVPVYCGDTYLWSNLICTPQPPAAPSTTWHFRVTAPEPGTELSFFLADDCNYALATWTTVPFTVLVPLCPPPPGHPIVALAIPPPPLQGPSATIQTSISVS